MLRPALIAIALALVLPAKALAQDPANETANLPGKFSFSVGAVFGADLDTKLRFDGSNGVGTTIDLESLLGLNSSAQSFLGTATWRPHRRHQLSVGWYGIYRSSERRIKRDITVGDSLWTVNTKVKSTMNTAFASLGYRWSIILNRRISAGISVLIPVTFVEAGLEVDASQAQARVSRNNDVTVPVPLPGLHATYRVSDPLYVDGHFQYLNVTVFDISADVIDWAVLLHYYPSRHFGVAGGISQNIYTIGGESGDWNGKLEYDVLGATAFLTYVP